MGEVLPKHPRAVTSVDARASVFKLAAEMVQLRTPLIAVTQNGKFARRDHRITPAGRGARILSTASARAAHSRGHTRPQDGR